MFVEVFVFGFAVEFVLHKFENNFVAEFAVYKFDLLFVVQVAHKVGAQFIGMDPWNYKVVHFDLINYLVFYI